MSKKIPIAIIAIIIIAVVIAAYGLTQSSSHTSNNSTNVTNSNELHATVVIENGTLNPATLTVKPGTTVEWIVKDPNTDNKYMVTSNKTEKEGMYLFMSDHLVNGQSFNYTFNGNGTYYYYDMDHMDNSTLTGTIIVQ